MSRIGEQPIPIPDGVTISVEDGRVAVNGALGALSLDLVSGIALQVADGRVDVTRASDTKRNRSLHGLTRSLVANMVEGVARGFSKSLEIQGVGFRAAVEGRQLSMALGFASDVQYEIPEGITVTVTGGTALTVSGTDKQKVGNTAARIRSFFPAEPYKGKGVRYKDEHVRRKVGKTVA